MPSASAPVIAASMSRTIRFRMTSLLWKQAMIAPAAAMRRRIHRARVRSVTNMTMTAKRI